jgi:hypothetical protein
MSIMVELEAIQSFVGLKIAIWRAHKKTFYALEWDGDSRTWRSWVPFNVDDLSRHTSSHHPGAATIIIGNGRSVTIRAKGEFLYNAYHIIPIVKISGQVPNTWKTREFGHMIPLAPGLSIETLWVAAPEQVPEPEPEPAPVLPRRIAVLVAENAVKNNDRCPITMEPISPLTAAVTTCYHVFDGAAIMTWLASNSQCPECRQPCSAVFAST